jgi:hypothetical protein
VEIVAGIAGADGGAGVGCVKGRGWGRGEFLRGVNGQRQSDNRMERDRIMAGQNHAEQSRNHCWPGHKWRGRMILSCHDSVGLPR